MALNTNGFPGLCNSSIDTSRRGASSTPGVYEEVADLSLDANRLKKTRQGFHGARDNFEELCRAEDVDCSEETFQANMRSAICQMMFVSGETGEPSTETTTMIEGIVQQQVVEMVSLRIHLKLCVEETH